MQVKKLLIAFLLPGTFCATYAKDLHGHVTQQSLSFIENKGQITDQFGNSRHDVNYRVGGSGLNMFIGGGQLHYQWAAPAVQYGADKQQVSLYRMDVTLVGADPQAKVIAEQKQGFFERYYTPQFGEQGATAYAYQKVTYKDVYPNIDWVLYVKDKTVEYDFVVRPGGKVSDIKLQYGGATNLNIDKAGRLTATTPMGSITEAAPVTYQQADGKAIASFFKQENNTISFTTGDYKGTLVIDPTLSWSTYYGGSLDEYNKNGSLTGDTSGNIYICGYTQSSTNIASTGAYQTTVAGGTDAFVAKFNKYGVRQWGTYYGGTLADYGTGIASDAAGNIFLSGYTSSTTGIATSGSYQTAIAGGSDAFLVKFDSAGARQWATYFGGSSTDQGLAVNTDRTGNVYITGYTSSTAGIASTGAHQTTKGSGQDAFLAKFSNAGTRIWSTYYGGSSSDQGFTTATDTSKNVYLSGYTRSTADIATAGAYQTTYTAGMDVFIVKFDSTGVRQWGTYYGGSGDEQCLSLSTDRWGSFYIAGYTSSSSGIATSSSHQPVYGGIEDGFLAKFSNSGNRIWATYYGGTAGDDACGVKCDTAGNVFLCGLSGSTAAIATTGGVQDTLNGAIDAFVIKFDSSGVRKWGTYFGGENEDYAYNVYTTPFSEVYISGMTSSITGVATTGSHQSTFGGNTFDAFLAKLNACELSAPASITGNDTVCRNGSYTYTAAAVTGATSYTWTLPVGWTGSSTTNTINITAATTSDTIKVVANFLCGTSTPVVKPVYVSALPTLAPTGTIKVCAGDSAALTASTGTAYQWLQAGAPISGATNATYKAHTANTYSVVVTNTNGCADTSLVDTLIVNPIPVPVITASGSVLSTGTYSTYQWSRNGTTITGAISPTYTMVVMSGDYTVTVKDSNGCRGTSTIYTPTTGIHEIGAGKTISIYPNPAKDWLYIDATEPVLISISAIDGKLLLDKAATQKINISDWAEGLYLLRIYDKKTGALLLTEKLVKSANNG